MKRVLVLVLAAILVLLSTQPNTAVAGSTTLKLPTSEKDLHDWDLTEEEFAELSPGDQRKVMSILTATTVTETITKSTPTETILDSCYSSWHTRQFRNVFGQLLVSYYQHISYCVGSDGRLTSVQRTRWGETHAPLWRFNGHIGNAESGGPGHFMYHAWTQGSFSLGTGGWDVQHLYPVISQTVP